MAEKLKQEYENLLELERQLTQVAKNEFLLFLNNCNNYIKTEDLKDEFEKNIKLLKTIKDIEIKR